MKDSAHDKEHVYRVLYTALEIAQGEQGADSDILVAACLLHDIGRAEQYENPSLCHAEVGAKKAYKFLVDGGFDTDFAQRVAECISCHRFRGDNPPESIEAKILFDADKIDVTGTLGIARTLYYQGIIGEPLYYVDENGGVIKGATDNRESFFKEYKYKLERVYDRLCTETGRRIANGRRASAVSFYNSMLSEVEDTYKNGVALLKNVID